MSVTIFSTSTCSWCAQLKKFLQIKNIPYSEINLDENPEKLSEVRKLTDALSVPITLVEKDGKQQVIRGYNPAKLMSAIA